MAEVNSSTISQGAAQTATDTHLEGGTTRDVFSRFQSLYNITLTENTFIGLCGYLNSLLIWGFEAFIVDFDRFIVCYPAFQSSLPELYEQQASAEEWFIPSYHRWLNDPSTLEVRMKSFEPAIALARGLILDEATLRQIWSENFFRFLHVEMSMQRIAIDVIQGAE